MSRRAFLASSTFAAISFATFSALSHVTLEVRGAKARTPYKAILRIPHGCDGTATLNVQRRFPKASSR